MFSSKNDIYVIDIPESKLNSKMDSSTTRMAMASTKKKTPKVRQTDFSPESSPDQYADVSKYKTRLF